MSVRRPALVGTSVAALLASGFVAAPAFSQDLDFEITNPYSSVDWGTFGQYKAGLHNHTTESDGGNTAAEMLERAYELDYNIFPITDHNFTNTSWDRTDRPATDEGGDPIAYLTTERMVEMNTGVGRDGAPGMVGIPNTNEQSRSDHINTFWTPWNNESGATMDSTLAMAEELGGLAQINHPGRYTGGKQGGIEGAIASSRPETVSKYTNLFTAHGSAIGMEIMNRPDNESKSDRILWDNILMQTMPGKAVWGWSNDDAHSTREIGRSYNYFVMPDLEESSIRAAMEQGTTYAIATRADNELGTEFVAQGPPPRVTDVVVDDEADTITIKADNATAVEWVADGEVIATGNTIDLDDHSDAVFTYVRAQVKGAGGIAFLNPFGVTGGNERPVIEVARVELAATGTTLDADSPESALTVTAFDAAGNEIDLGKALVAFEIDTPGILSIDEDGVVTVANAPLANMMVSVRATVISGMSTAQSAPVTFDVNVGSDGYYLMVPVRTGSDDVEEFTNQDGRMYFNSSDLELTEERPGDVASRQTIGIRYDGLNIPAGAKVTEAYIQFTVDEPGKSTGAFRVDITGEATANSAAFADEAYNASTRTRTGASVEWTDVADWAARGDAGPDQRTPDLSAIVNEIIGQEGWQTGNALTFLIEGEGARTADAREAGAERGPVLHVAYELPGEGGEPGSGTDEGDIPVTAEIPGLDDEGTGGEQPGTLALSIADGGLTMSNPRNAGNHVRLTGVLPDVRVTDTRADEAGWSLTGASSDLTADMATLRAENLGWEPFLVDGDAAPGGVVEPRLLGGLGLAAPAILGTSVGGVGSDTLAADVTLAAPVDTRAGTYTGGVTVSLFPQD